MPKKITDHFEFSSENPSKSGKSKDGFDLNDPLTIGLIIAICLVLGLIVSPKLFKK